MKYLQIFRHAKSSWKDLSLSDHDRPLNKRGKKAAPLMGKRLAIKEVCPDMIISSTAKRAIKTANLLAQETNCLTQKIITKKSMYHASVTELLALISHTNNTINTLMIVGHNPGLTSLANYLCDCNPYFANIPTAGLVTLSININKWEKILSDSSELTITLLDYDYPKRN